MSKEKIKYFIRIAKKIILNKKMKYLIYIHQKENWIFEFWLEWKNVVICNTYTVIYIN